MSENKSEQQSIQPSKEVQLGQWFRPFENYAKIPPGNARYRPKEEEFFSKRFKFTTPDVGKWAVTTRWDQVSYKEAKDPISNMDEHSIVVLPNAEKIISNLRELLSIQEETEIRLMVLGFDDDEGTKADDEWNNKYKNLGITLRLPSGKELYADFSEGEGSGNSWALDWRDMYTNEIYENVYLSDSGNFMEQIQMKIEKTRGGEN